MKTYKQYIEWCNKQRESGAYSTSYYDFYNPGDVVDSELYYDQLEVLPPQYMKGSLFQVGEPADSIGNEYTYSTFNRVRGKYIWLGNMTTNEAKRVRS